MKRPRGSCKDYTMVYRNEIVEQRFRNSTTIHKV